MRVFFLRPDSSLLAPSFICPAALVDRGSLALMAARGGWWRTGRRRGLL